MTGPFRFSATLAGMADEDSLCIVLPAEFGCGTIFQLLERVFPPDEEQQAVVESRFDIPSNPDLPEIYGVFLAAFEEWRQWRCHLLVSETDGQSIDLASQVSEWIDPPQEDSRPALPCLKVCLEQQYHAVDYGVRSDFWGGKEELLEWLRSMTVLYFLDKHEVDLDAQPAEGEELALAPTLELLRCDGLIEESEDGGTLVVSEEGRRLIGRLLAETESCIDRYDHFKDTMIDVDGERVEFGTGRGIDLRVQVFAKEGLDPVRTVFLLRLYDGSLDEHLPVWTEIAFSCSDGGEGFFDSILEPVVNRYDVGDVMIGGVIEHGYGYLEERWEEAREQEAQRVVRRRVRRRRTPGRTGGRLYP